MSGYYNPSQNPNGYNAGYTSQGPIYTPTGPGIAPQHPPLNGNPGYFGNGVYGSPTSTTAPYSAYNQPPFNPNPGPMSPSSDNSSNKKPLPTPRARPMSVVYPGQPLPSSSFAPSGIVPMGTVHQRSMTFDQNAYGGMAQNNVYGVVPNVMNNVPLPGTRPASVAFPPGWNPYPPIVTSPPVAAPMSMPMGGIAPPPPKKDADLPPIPPGAGSPNSPGTPTSGTVPSRRALPSAPGQPGPGVPLSPGPGQGPPSMPWAQPAGMPTGVPEKRPLPTSSPSLPRIGTLASMMNNGQGPPTSAIPPAGGTSPSSPTKRALPTAPGGGGIKPGTTLPANSPPPPPSTFIPQSSFSIPGSSFQAPASAGTQNPPPSSDRQSPQPPSRQDTPPTSAPSSYASARSVFSTTPSARASSYTSPSPPPTGAPRSAASDVSGAEDKRPLWKRMASGQQSSRPQSVFGHRKGTPSTGGEAPARSTQEASPPSEPAKSSAPAPTPVPSSSVPTATPAARNTPLPTPPTMRTTPIASAAVPPPASASTSRQMPSPPSAQPSLSTSTVPTNVPKIPAGVQPTPIVPYTPKQKRPKASDQPAPAPVDVPPLRTDPVQSRVLPTAIPAGPAGPSNAPPPAIIPVGKVRFSKETEVNPIIEVPSRPSTVGAGPASPPRASALKGGNGARSPPKVSRMEAHSRSASTPAQQHQVLQQQQGQGQSHARSRMQPMYQVPLAKPAPDLPPSPAPAPTQPSSDPQVSMALRFASMDIQDVARSPNPRNDWAKWALVSSHDVATKPVPLTGYPASQSAGAPASPPAARASSAAPDDQGRVKEGKRRRSASAGAIAAVHLDDIQEQPPPPAAVRRGSFDDVQPVPVPMNTSALIQAAAASGGMRRGGARPMPSSSSSRAPASRARSRTPSEEYPQYKPGADSDSEDDGPGPKITISAAPQITVSAPQITINEPEVPSINVESDDMPAITITIDEPEPSPAPSSSKTPMSAASIPIIVSGGGPEESDQEEAASSGGGKKKEKKKKHRREKSVKEEEDERERARQRAKTQPLPPKIKKNSARCGKCDKIIMGRIVSAMNARWHPECFRCSVCETFLEHVSSYEHDDRPYCHLDYHELFAPRCFHCKTPIMEEHFITLDDESLGKRTYHEQHFFCAECGDPFLAPKQVRKTRQLDNGMLEVLDQDDEVGFTVYKGHPYCEACHVRLRMPKCKRCKKSIRPGDQAIEALGAKWCWHCFTCNRCSKPFDDPQFYEHEQRPYCQPCYSILLVNQLG